MSESFDSDSVENIELGAKLSLLENRLQFNAALYRIDWKDIPLRVFAGKLPSQDEPTCFTGIIANSGEARSQGFELEGTYQVHDTLRLDFGAAYTDVELTSVVVGLPFAVGDRLAATPDYSLNFAVQYDFSFVDRDAYIRSDYAYVNEFYGRVGEQGEKAGGYGQVNLNAGIQFAQVSVELFAQNLTGEDAVTGIGTLYPDTRAYRLRPRTIGLTVGFDF